MKINNINKAETLAKNYYKAGKSHKAEDICRMILEVYPTNAKALHLLGRIALNDDEPEKAIKYIERAVEADSTVDYYYCDLGVAFRALNKLPDAIAAFDMAIDINPRNDNAFINKGIVCKVQGNLEWAAEAFQRAVNINSDNLSAKHFLAALTGHTTRKAPRKYIVDLFDQYSEQFDRHLLHVLEYRLPEVINRELKSFCGLKKFRQVVDLGCGTGLIGKEIRWAAKRLIGVDLSPKMIAHAWQKKIYDMIFEYDMIDFLSETKTKYDLLIAADVLIYIGDLIPFFESIRNCIDKNAFMILTTEKCNPYDFQLLPTGRYAHSVSYIENLARSYDFTIEFKRCLNVRREAGKWIEGNLFAMRAN